ncbi:MAG: UDP-2,4-diacetamido-2,4,6-trideoxy-beta-L-altropyranose hydrolase [Nitrospirae bacterium]|nr:UDP-2,4-diacetamido-2,4,6-trideoxy-beta-L-altropyranose hydrolase [Nitrospirota bacterium]
MLNTILMKTVVMRADAFEGIGTGHLMRCMALGQTLSEAGVRVVFVSRCDPRGIVERIEGEGFGFVPLDAGSQDVGLQRRLITSQWADWIVADGVHFDEAYHEFLRSCGCRLAVIDDMARLSRYDADIVLNQNLHAHDLHYKCPRQTRLLLGAKYVLLRREFLRSCPRPPGASWSEKEPGATWSGKEKVVPDVGKNLLITLGGIDKGNFTQKILLAVKDTPGLDIIAIVGAGNPHVERLRSVKMASRLTVIQNATDMPSLMSWADAAITSGGTTVWELAFMGVPSIVGRVATIEDYLVGGLNKHGLFVDAGWFDSVEQGAICTILTGLMSDANRRQEMSIKAQRTVTGEGCMEVFREMNRI